MKKILFSLIWVAMTVTGIAQIRYYDSTKHRAQKACKEDITLEFGAPIDCVKIKGKEAAFAGIIPTIVDAGFKIVTKAIDKHVKKFTAEYSKFQSNRYAFDGNIRALNFVRTIWFDDTNRDTAFSLTLKPSIDKMGGSFYYYVDSIEVRYSAAKRNKKKPYLDYVIELQLTYLDKDNKEKTVDLGPISINSIKGTWNDSIDGGRTNKYRTAWVTAFSKGILAANIKIVETNPAKVRAEKIQSLWTDHSDGVKAIINNFLPENKSGGGGK